MNIQTYEEYIYTLFTYIYTYSDKLIDVLCEDNIFTIILIIFTLYTCGRAYLWQTFVLKSNATFLSQRTLTLNDRQRILEDNLRKTQKFLNVIDKNVKELDKKSKELDKKSKELESIYKLYTVEENIVNIPTRPSTTRPSTTTPSTTTLAPTIKTINPASLKSMARLHCRKMYGKNWWDHPNKRQRLQAAKKKIKSELKSELKSE